MKEVAVGIIRSGERILACQRRPDAVYPLKWEFPGGKLEAGETSDQALRRELREELGIDALVGPALHRQEWTYPDSAGIAGRDGAFRVTYHLVDGYSGEPVNRVFADIRWVTLPQLRSMDVLEGNREVFAILGKGGLDQGKG